MAQNFKVITAINENVKVQIEGVGTVRQIEIADKLYAAGVINWKCRMASTRIALTNNLINTAINVLNFYPKESRFCSNEKYRRNQY